MLLDVEDSSAVESGVFHLSSDSNTFQREASYLDFHLGEQLL